MVNLDLSKVFPHRALPYIVATFPGLFFEVSLSLGDAGLITALLWPPREFLKVGPYVEIFIALFLAFVVGNLAMSAVTVGQYFLRYIYRFKVFITGLICKEFLFPLSNKLLTKPAWMRRRFAQEIHRYAVDQAFPNSSGEWDGYVAWRAAAEKLLETKYGVDLYGQGMWKAWQFFYWNLGELTGIDRRGDLMLIATHASGWCGFAAAWLAPNLRNRYYLLFCGMMVAIGLFHDYQVARNLTNPVALAAMRLRAVLRLYKDVPASVKDETRLPASTEESTI